MRPWAPRTLVGQLALVLVSATLLAQVASLMILAHERRFAMEGLKREQVLERLVTAVDLIGATPAGMHEDVTRATSTKQTRLWLSNEPAVRGAAARADEKTQHQLAALLGNRALSVRVERGGLGVGSWRAWLGYETEPPNIGPAGGSAAQTQMGFLLPRELEVSIELAQGRWLNAHTVLPRLPAVPAVSALLSTSITAALIAGAALLMVRRITRPLRALADAADRLGRGERGSPLSLAGPAEIRRTTRAFNLMRERLARFVGDRTRLLAALGHDLRTPITSLRLRAEFIAEEETRARVIDTLDEMGRMVEATLTFTREEASSELTRIVDLGALVESICADLVDLGREVTVAEAARVALPCRPVGLKRAIRNLVENAVTYGCRARVTITRSDRGLAVVDIEDDGPGIPEAELERVFEPFTRLEPSRSPATGGIGLGLAIARTIARAHGGDVRLDNRAGGGLTASLSLPLPQTAV